MQRARPCRTSPEPAQRANAAEHLSRLGSDARAAAVPLVRACADESEDVREWVTAALEELGPPSANDVSALATLLGNENADVGYWAATLLGRLGPEAVSAVPALASAVSDSVEMSVRQRAAWALGKIGPPACDALDALRQATVSSNSRLARLAQRAVARLGG
jgi:HEAT repeat protein